MSERWHTLSVEDVVDKLDTDVRFGLKNSEAVSRKKIRNDGSVFSFPNLSSSDAARLVLNDVTLYFFFFLAAIVCAVFELWTAAIAAVVIVLVNCMFTVGLKITSNKYENAVMAPSVPRVTVIRDGKKISIDGRNAVPGDIILLKAGDILPCDVRIVKARELTAYETVSSDEKGRPVNARTVKHEGILPVNAKLSIDKISNMVFAGGMIMSGSAIGIVVSCGKNTYIAKRFSGIEMTTANKYSRIDETLSAFFRYSTNILFALAIPFSLVLLLFGGAAVSPLDSIAQTMTLAVSMPMQTITVIYSTVICCAVRYCARPSDKFGRNGAILKNYPTVGRLDSASKIFMFGRNTIAGAGDCVESMFVNLKKIVSPDDTEDPQEVKGLLDCAYLINKAASTNGKHTGALRDNERIFLRSMAEFAIDSERITQSAGFLSYKRLAGETLADAAIVSEGNDFAQRSFLVCRTFDSRIIECAEWYSSDGVDVKLDDITRERILNEYYALKDLGYDVVSIAKAASSLYDCSSFSEYDDQLVFVGIVAVGPSYSRENADSVKELVSQGISPVLCFDDESAENTYIVKNVFRKIKRELEIVKASEIAGTGYTVNDYPHADAYLGFSKKEIMTLIENLAKSGTVCASVVTEVSDIHTASRSQYVVAYSNDPLSENSCTEPYPNKVEDAGASCSMAKRYADMLVSPVSVLGGGLDGVLRAFSCVRSFFANLERAVSYLISSLIMRIIAVYLPLIFGRPSMNPAMILYLGCIVDLAAVFFMSCTGFSTDKKKTGAVSFTSVLSVLKANISPFVFAVLNGCIIAGAGLLIPKTDNGSLSDYLFVALLAVQLSTFVYTSLRGCEKIKARDIWRAVIFALAVFAFTVIIGIIPGVSAVLGIASSVTVWIRAAVVLVICSLIGFVFLKDRFFA